jgi:hypothetical protein
MVFRSTNTHDDIPPPYPRTHVAVHEYIMVVLVPHIGLAQRQYRLSGVAQHQGDLVFDEIGHDVGMSVGVKQDLEGAVQRECAMRMGRVVAEA